MDPRPDRLTGDELLDEIRALYAAGLTIAELSARLQRSAEVIRRLMISASIPRRPRGQPPAKYLPNGGRTIDKNGYVLLRAYGHPFANSAGYVREHRLVMEQALGRYLLPEEVVHHINGDKADNRIENLELFESNAAHKQFDMVGNSWAKGDFNNPKRRVRNYRSKRQMLDALRHLSASLDRPIRRADLCPPNPSYRAIARAFGTWRIGVALALAGWDGIGPQPELKERPTDEAA